MPRATQPTPVAPPQVPPIGPALHAARVAAGHTLPTFAAVMGVSARQVARWEMGESFLPSKRYAALLGALQAAPRARLATLRQALGVDPLPAESPAAAPPKPASPCAVADAMYTLAEALDVGPKRLRAELVAFLDALSALGVSAKEARDALAIAPPASPPRR